VSSSSAGGAGFKQALISIAAGLVVACVLIQLSGYSAPFALSALWSGATGLQAGPATGPTDVALGSGHVNLFQLAQSLATVTPLLFCGLAVALGLRAGLFNIGAQGQLTVGALAAAAVGLIGAPEAAGSAPLHAPAALRVLAVACRLPLVHIALTFLAGALAGAAWGAIAGALKAWRGVHEVITTIMLNFIGLDVANYLVTHSLRDPHSPNPETPRMAETAILRPLVAHSNLTAGLILALIAAAAVALFIARTSPGFAIRAVGLNNDAAEAAGISTARVLVLSMALAGALAGAAGAIEVMGVHHRYVEGVAGSYGFDGIAVALLGGVSGGAILSALFFGLLAAGSDTMQAFTSVPAPVAVIVQATVIMFVGIRRFGRFAPTAKAGDGGDSARPADAGSAPALPAATDHGRVAARIAADPTTPFETGARSGDRGSAPESGGPADGR